MAVTVVLLPFKVDPRRPLYLPDRVVYALLVHPLKTFNSFPEPLLGSTTMDISAGGELTSLRVYDQSGNT